MPSQGSTASASCEYPRHGAPPANAREDTSVADVSVVPPAPLCSGPRRKRAGSTQAFVWGEEFEEESGGHPTPRWAGVFLLVWVLDSWGLVTRHLAAWWSFSRASLTTHMKTAEFAVVLCTKESCPVTPFLKVV